MCEGLDAGIRDQDLVKTIRLAGAVVQACFRGAERTRDAIASGNTSQWRVQRNQRYMSVVVNIAVPDLGNLASRASPDWSMYLFCVVRRLC